MSAIIVTGGLGFIGSAVVRKLINDSDFNIVLIDKLSYSANISSIASVLKSPPK